MPRNNDKEKSFTLLEKELSVILSVNNPKLSPYLDVFRHYPENVSLQNLGILSGFFKINDLSDESAYIVNFVSSVLKKEYYANPKRSIENGFDSALRKVNLALSEIAKEGNINWLGKIDGAVCILEKNNLHFSVCGKAKVFLLRNQSLSEISADMAPSDVEPSPLKTFVDVSSGRLEKGDKLIICNDDVFKVFSEEEIRKGAIRFDPPKFVQFIKTALTNKLDLVGAIIIDTFEKVEEKTQPEPETEVYNVFSKKVFEEKNTIPKGLNEMLQPEENSAYTDGKTGHIYIQEEEGGTKKESNFEAFWLSFKEKSGDFYYWLKNKTRKRFFIIGKSISKSKGEMMANLKLKMEERKRLKAEKQERLEKEKVALAAVTLEEEKIKAAEAEKLALKSKTEVSSAIKPEEIKKEEPEESIQPIEEIARPIYQEPFLARLAKRKEELEKQEIENAEEPQESKLSSFKKIIPDFGKVKNLYASFSGKQKLYALVVLLFIFVVPFVFLKIQGAMKNKPDAQQATQNAPDSRELFSQEKNIVFLDNLDNVFSIQNPKAVMLLNGKLIAMSDSQTITKDPDGNVKEIPWNQSYGAIREASPMKDLNLALAYTDQNKVISFLSATSQFADNVISIPGDASITGLGTYLTYAYFLDSKNNQIYRYPRATGGFGEKTNWLKDNLPLENSCCMAIDENVYLISDGKVLKIFKGQDQSLSLEQTVNSYVPGKIFTDSDTQNLYVLDNGNGRIIKYSKDGALLSQYFHEDIKKSTDFTVDEKNSKAYLSNSEGIASFDLQ